MILNTGSRTDIPAFYAEWFVRRVREGFVMARSPYDPRRITRYILDPAVVDLIVFCTKNPAPLLEKVWYNHGGHKICVLRDFALMICYA